MEPYAYVLREDHPVFTTPLTVDFSKNVQIEVPDAWKNELEGPQVTVLPMVDNRSTQYSDGWCTYTYEHVQAPEMEIVCGGVNAKTVKASGIWLQGNLLHFGFEQSPEEMNENGRAMLVNSICYVARFGDSRPIIRRSSDVRWLDRGAIDRLIKNKERELAPYLDWYFAGELRATLGELSRDELANWYRENHAFLTIDPQGKFVIDATARRLEVSPAAPKFVPTMIAALREGGGAESAGRRLLERYVPDGPPADAPADQWQQWWTENGRFVFFSDSGGFRWYLDPLAKRRGTPTQALRGVARAAH